MVLSESQVRNLIDDHHFNLYLKKLSNHFLKKNEKLKQCKQTSCDIIFYCEQPSSDEILCHCGFKSCGRCQCETHKPCRCDQVALWFSKQLNDEISYQQILADCTKCVKCQTNIFKNGGCNFMKCS